MSDSEAGGAPAEEHGLRDGGGGRALLGHGELLERVRESEWQAVDADAKPYLLHGEYSGGGKVEWSFDADESRRRAEAGPCLAGLSFLVANGCAPDLSLVIGNAGGEVVGTPAGLIGGGSVTPSASQAASSQGPAGCVPSAMASSTSVQRPALAASIVLCSPTVVSSRSCMIFVSWSACDGSWNFVSSGPCPGNCAFMQSSSAAALSPPPLAATLFGKENRWGKLPATMYPHHFIDEKAMTDYDMSAGVGRTYKYYLSLIHISEPTRPY